MYSFHVISAAVVVVVTLKVDDSKGSETLHCAGFINIKLSQVSSSSLDICKSMCCSYLGHQILREVN